MQYDKYSNKYKESAQESTHPEAPVHERVCKTERSQWPSLILSFYLEHRLIRAKNEFLKRFSLHRWAPYLPPEGNSSYCEDGIRIVQDSLHLTKCTPVKTDTEDCDDLSALLLPNAMGSLMDLCTLEIKAILQPCKVDTRCKHYSGAHFWAHWLSILTQHCHCHLAARKVVFLCFSVLPVSVWLFPWELWFLPEITQNTSKLTSSPVQCSCPKAVMKIWIPARCTWLPAPPQKKMDPVQRTNFTVHHVYLTNEVYSNFFSSLHFLENVC